MSEDKLIRAINDFKDSIKGAHTISIHGKDYVQVAPRIGIARRCLGASLDIVTEIKHIDKESVVVCAHVYIDGKHIASGHAEEMRRAGKINATSALENCETSAVGRALAFCAFITDGIASAEEVELAEREAKAQEEDKKERAAREEAKRQERLQYFDDVANMIKRLYANRDEVGGRELVDSIARVDKPHVASKLAAVEVEWLASLNK